MIKGEQIISMNTNPYYVDGRKKPLWQVNYTFWWVDKNGNFWEDKTCIIVDNPTMRRLERFKIERHKFNYLAEIINRVNE